MQGRFLAQLKAGKTGAVASLNTVGPGVRIGCNLPAAIPVRPPKFHSGLCELFDCDCRLCATRSASQSGIGTSARTLQAVSDEDDASRGCTDMLCPTGPEGSGPQGRVIASKRRCDKRVRMRPIGMFCMLLLSICFVPVVEDSLLSRSPATASGSDYQANYDDALDITWLADANAAFTSGFDEDGLLAWFEAQTWTGAVDIYGVGGWRPPSSDIRKNGVFCDSVAGANLCRLFETATTHGVEPYRYVR